MNLVMSDITRNKLGCYMAQQASLNNIPVSALVSRFTVEPAVQQRFENASKESTEFTKRINVIGVTDQKGEKILLDTTGPIARTNSSYDGIKRRKPTFLCRPYDIIKGNITRTVFISCWHDTRGVESKVIGFVYSSCVIRHSR